MLLLDAFVMAADLYPESAGWIIQCETGRIEMKLFGNGPAYAAYDSMLLRASRRLEVAVAELIGRHPECMKDKHWKISPRGSLQEEEKL